MDGLFIEFRDPLFGIIVFFVLVFVIALFSYWWGRFKKHEDYRHLDRFIKQFHTAPTKTELKELIGSGTLSEKSWFLLANTYTQNGDYEKSIEIYQLMIGRQQETNARRDTLFLLGQTYFKAGFLERSKEIFLQLLKDHPRTPQALHYLLLIYEKLNDFKSAADVLEPLHELGADSQKEHDYLYCLSLLHDADLGIDEKTDRLIDFYQRHHTQSYLIFDYLFKHSPRKAWKHFDQAQAERISDILWGLEQHQCNLDIIANNGYLRELFTAKGYVDHAQNSGSFELDVLIKLHKGGHSGATLSFEYLCRHCKQVLPFAFHRCPNCNAIDSVWSEPILTKEYFEKDLSFQ
ncbi:MAG: tetratricopeptide repeat protein [Sulfurimonadaceae bacterium]|nr:tetratricopeptide repeat protein [Sulfurimonadaceae bacterium]